MAKDGNIRINFLVTKELRDKVKIKAVQKGQTIKQVVNDLLEKWLKK